MQNIIDWLYATALSQWLQTTVWVIPTVQIIHIVCIGLLFTSSAMLSARLLGVAGTRHTTESAASRFLPWVWWALPILLLSGSLLVIAEPNRSLQNTAFWLKMALIIVVCLIMLVFQRLLQGGAMPWDASPRRKFQGRLIGIASIIAWVSIVFCGRLIAYV